MRSKYGKPSTHSYATTVLALAQVYQALGSKDKSARYRCAGLSLSQKLEHEYSLVAVEHIPSARKHHISGCATAALPPDPFSEYCQIALSDSNV